MSEGIEKRNLWWLCVDKRAQKGREGLEKEVLGEVLEGGLEEHKSRPKGTGPKGIWSILPPGF